MFISLARRGIVLVTGIFVSTLLFAAEANGPMTISIPRLEPGQEMRILTVDLSPGQASQRHRHNAHVFVYVLEGNVEAAKFLVHMLKKTGDPLTVQVTD